MRSPRKPLAGLLPVATSLAIVLTARASFADHYHVPSESMFPTVHVGDRIVVSKVTYGIRVPLTRSWLATFRTPARGDVVVLEPPEPLIDPGPGQALPAVLLKRVVALPNEWVEVRAGHVLVGGKPIDEPWASVSSGSGPDFGPARVPSESVLVLGDNRGNSRDGRIFGFVAIRDVIGRATHVFVRDAKLAHQAL